MKPDRNVVISLIDQGLVSAGTFLTNLLAARLTAPELFGTYALYLGVMQLMNNIQGTLIVYPCSLLISMETGNNTGKRSPLKAAVIISAASSILVGALGVLLVAIFNQKQSSIIAVPALAAWQVQEVFRRALMAELRFTEAAIGDFISYPMQALLVFMSASNHKVSLDGLFACILITSVLGCIIQGFMLNESINKQQLPLSNALRVFWRTGRWNLIGVALVTSSVQGLPAMIALRFGSTSVAGYLATLSVVSATHPIIFGITNAGIPKIARTNARLGIHAACAEGLKIASWGALAVAGYLFLVICMPETTLTTFFGKSSPYRYLTTPLRLLCLNHLFFYISAASIMILSGLDESRRALKGNCVYAICSISIAIPAAALFGITGAAAGLALSSMGKAVMHLGAVAPNFKLQVGEAKQLPL